MGNLEVFDLGEGIALLADQGEGTWQNAYQQVGAGDALKSRSKTARLETCL